MRPFAKKNIIQNFFFVYKYGNLTFFLEKFLDIYLFFWFNFKSIFFWEKYCQFFSIETRKKILGWNLKGKEEGNHFLKNEISSYP
jgi:hypothetical protein